MTGGAPQETRHDGGGEERRNHRTSWGQRGAWRLRGGQRLETYRDTYAKLGATYHKHAE